MIMSSSEEPRILSHEPEKGLGGLSRAERFAELPDFIVYDQDGFLAVRYAPSASGPGNDGFDIKLPHRTKIGEFENPARVFLQKYGAHFLRSQMPEAATLRPGRHPCGGTEPVWERGSAEGFRLDLRSVAYRIAQERDREIREGTVLIYCRAAHDGVERALDLQLENIVRRGDFCKVIWRQADRDFPDHLKQLSSGLFERNYPYGCSGAYSSSTASVSWTSISSDPR